MSTSTVTKKKRLSRERQWCESLSKRGHRKIEDLVRDTFSAASWSKALVNEVLTLFHSQAERDGLLFGIDDSRYPQLNFPRSRGAHNAESIIAYLQHDLKLYLNAAIKQLEDSRNKLPYAIVSDVIGRFERKLKRLETITLESLIRERLRHYDEINNQTGKLDPTKTFKDQKARIDDNYADWFGKNNLGRTPVSSHATKLMSYLRTLTKEQRRFDHVMSREVLLQEANIVEDPSFTCAVTRLEHDGILLAKQTSEREHGPKKWRYTLLDPSTGLPPIRPGSGRTLIS